LARRFGSLPPALGALVIPLKIVLGLPTDYETRSTSFLLRSTRLPPFLWYADWALDDLGAPLDEVRVALEDGLFQVAAFGMVAALVVEQVQDRQPGAASTDLLLVQVIQRWADEALARIGHAGAFALATEFSTEQAEALAIWRQAHVGRVLAFTDTDGSRLPKSMRLLSTRRAARLLGQEVAHELSMSPGWDPRQCRRTCSAT
jgi:hypothetical protein